MPITILTKLNAAARGVDIRITSTPEVRRRINKRFGKGTFTMRDNYIAIKTPGGEFRYVGARNIGSVYASAFYEMTLPVLNMLIAVGAARLTELYVDTRQPGETYGKHLTEIFK